MMASTDAVVPMNQLQGAGPPAKGSRMRTSSTNTTKNKRNDAPMILLNKKKAAPVLWACRPNRWPKYP